MLERDRIKQEEKKERREKERCARLGIRYVPEWEDDDEEDEKYESRYDKLQKQADYEYAQEQQRANEYAQEQQRASENQQKSKKQLHKEECQRKGLPYWPELDSDDEDQLDKSGQR